MPRAIRAECIVHLQDSKNSEKIEHLSSKITVKDNAILEIKTVNRSLEMHWYLPCSVEYSSHIKNINGLLHHIHTLSSINFYTSETEFSTHLFFTCTKLAILSGSMMMVNIVKEDVPLVEAQQKNNE
jgi:hypothetical protein